VAGIPETGLIGKSVRLTIVGTDCTCYVDGSEVMFGTTGITGAAHMGMMLRGHPMVGHLMYDLNFQGHKVGAVTYHGAAVTYKGEDVTHA
jgi:hypothetical protein